MLKTQITLIKKTFKSHTAYPAAIFWGLVSSFLFFFIQASLWSALLDEGQYEGIGFSHMITYLFVRVCSEPFTGFRLSWFITRPFKMGDLAIAFVRPLSFKEQIYCEALGTGMFRFLVDSLPLMVMVMLVYSVILPVSLLNSMIFVLTLFLGLIIGNQLNYIIGLFVFWFKSDYYTKFLSGALVLIFGGTMVPIWFYPEGLARICSFLPYQLIVFRPMEIYLGREDNPFFVVALALFWIILLALIENIVWCSAKKIVVIHGG